MSFKAQVVQDGENKFKVLREAGYAIKGNCGFCVHADFRDGMMWGQCKHHRYEHAKHLAADADGMRGVSIVQIGSCPSFEEDAQKLNWLGLGAHSEFLPGRVPAELPPSKGRKQRRQNGNDT